jgi:hypothetical protein
MGLERPDRSICTHLRGILAHRHRLISFWGRHGDGNATDAPNVLPARARPPTVSPPGPVPGTLACLPGSLPAAVGPDIETEYPGGNVRPVLRRRASSEPGRTVQTRDLRLRQDISTAMIRTIVAAGVLALASPFLARPLPLPKQLGQECPSGYASGAHWCTPKRGTTRQAIRKGQRACPSGWVQAGAYCLSPERPWR